MLKEMRRIALILYTTLSVLFSCGLSTVNVSIIWIRQRDHSIEFTVNVSTELDKTGKGERQGLSGYSALNLALAMLHLFLCYCEISTLVGMLVL